MDVPGATADIHALRTMLQSTQKHIWIQPYSAPSVEYLIELAKAAAGGEKLLKNRSPVSFISCSLTPLEIKYMDAEIIFQASRCGIPIHACSLPTAGGTAPITMPGLITLSAAEILAQVAITQVIQPGAPVIATPIIFALDMVTGRSMQSSLEAVQGAAAAVYLLKNAFGLPTHTYGFGSDSPEIDGQSLSERSLLSLLVSLAGANILGGAGQVEVATTISPVQLVLDNELAAMVRRIVSGMTVNDDTLAWEDLLNISPPGGHFLESEHTLLHCRDAFRPLSFTRISRETWFKQGQKDLIARATDVYKKLKEKVEPYESSDVIIREMASIVETADRQLIK